MAGLRSGWSEWKESATDSMSQVKSAATQTFDGIAHNMAAMLTGSEQNWRSFTRSVLSMLTEIFLKQAMVGIVGRIGSAIGGAFGGGASASTGTAIQAAAANFHFATGDLREPVANMSQRGLSTAGSLSSRRRQPAGLVSGTCTA
ncbi:hypothetical protein ECZU34_53020 [Escherichia coli]|nr:hypothetical protein ECZU17_43430 [Escherichia coli]GHL23391.1 hypothetical protein ECZU25_02040 [Escherichia coli]GHL77554.1 hypothetical protein ECZU34_53020 [Escherichia coli]